MKKNNARLVLSLAMLIGSLSVAAQQNHFIYIQTENKQSFYVKMDKKVFSSSGSGYVIIPQLKDGPYTLSVGFPKSEWPEQAINCTVSKKDEGFLLKNFGEKGWGLFNLQTLEILTAANAADKTLPTKENKQDVFSDLLANAVNDSTIRQKDLPPPVAAKEVPPVKPAITAVSVPSKENKSAAVEIKRLLYIPGKKGTEIIYSDRSNGQTDTIRILIPADPVVVQEQEMPAPSPEETAKTAPPKADPPPVAVPPATSKEAETKPKEKFINMELPNPNTGKTPDTQVKETNVIVQPTPVKKAIMVNSNCKDNAGEDDFLKLRKKMAAAENDEDMVAAARKAFKTKCYTVEQIKNLGFLFLNDKGRYQFFDAAYPFAADSENFSSLEAQLKDEYQINRFRAMVTH